MIIHSLLLHLLFLRYWTGTLVWKHTGICVNTIQAPEDQHSSELYLKTQSVPRSKHTPSRLYKPVS